MGRVTLACTVHVSPRQFDAVLCIKKRGTNSPFPGTGMRHEPREVTALMFHVGLARHTYRSMRCKPDAV